MSDTQSPSGSRAKRRKIDRTWILPAFDEVDNTDTIVSNVQSTEGIKKKGSSQIIEGESEDLSQFVEEFFNTDFGTERNVEDRVEKSVPTVNKGNEKPKEPVAKAKTKNIETSFPPSGSRAKGWKIDRTGRLSAFNEVDSIDTIVSNVQSTEGIKKKGSTQIIEDESEDLSQFVEEFFNTDFGMERNVEDRVEKSVPTVNKENKKTKEPVAQAKTKNIEKETIESEILNRAFNIEFSKFITQASDIEVSVDTKEIPLPLTTSADKEEVFRFYWWDAYEDPYRLKGILYLIGKVFVPSIKKYCSCCLTVQVPRRIYLLPRVHVKGSFKESDEEAKLVTMEDVYKEFNQYADRSGIKEFRCKTVSRHYAFEKEGTPMTADYLEVRYSVRYPAMLSSYTGPTIERVFGTTVNPMELLLIERNIKGPCWLDVKCPLPTDVRTSWCKINVTCMNMENISVCNESQALPPLVITALNLRTSLNSKSQKNEVVMIAILTHHEYHVNKESPKPPFQQHICLITHPNDTPWPREAQEMLSNISYTEVMRFDTELDLLTQLLKIMNSTDPDVLIGYDCGFQFDTLLIRMLSLQISDWSNLGRLYRRSPPYFEDKVNLNKILAGRPFCDIQVSAKELNLKVPSYDLQSLCTAVLKKTEYECKEVKPGECAAFYNTTSKIDNLIKITLIEALYILTIVFDLNVLPLALQLTCIAGNAISRTLTAGCAERNEYLLLHAFHLKQYITPDTRIVKNENADRKKAGYAGGLVLEPRKGFYDKLILLMDFNSLYPSIIQEYNLCFTTVPGAAFVNCSKLTFPEPNLEPGVLPTEIRKLVESRVEVKNLMKATNISPELKTQYNIRQLALKLTANSMYGCLGATYYRFYAKGLAALITAKGREILLNTKTLVEKLNYEVIYGDTDSLMINTNLLEYEEVFAVGKKIKQEVNKLYKKVELDIDGVFRYLLLLQKKKYAAATIAKLPNGQVELTQEHKGLDIVRRDWCRLACDAGKKILDQLLSDQSNENRLEQIFSMLQNVAKTVRERKVPPSSLVIRKQLSKNPNEYQDNKPAHVQVALRLNKRGGRMWKAGDTVPYIICDDGTEKSATERAYHIDEYEKSKTLRIDVNYYLSSQVFPIALRICDPIEGIDDVLLAQNLGLDKSKTLIHKGEIDELLLINDDRFRLCLPLKFYCTDEKCRSKIIFKDVIIETPSGKQLSLASCSNPDCTVQPWRRVNAVQNAMDLAVQELVTEYYNCEFECPFCGKQPQTRPLDFHRKYRTCAACSVTDVNRVYSGKKLYDQMCFYRHLFDVSPSKYTNLLSQHPQGMREAYDILKEAMERHINRNTYSTVCLDTLFSGITLEHKTGSLYTGWLDLSD